MLELLNGKKTYIVSGLGLVVCGLWIFGVVDGETASQALAALGFGGAITLRSGIAKAS